MKKTVLLALAFLGMSNQSFAVKNLAEIPGIQPLLTKVPQNEAEAQNIHRALISAIEATGLEERIKHPLQLIQIQKDQNLLIKEAVLKLEKDLAEIRQRRFAQTSRPPVQPVVPAAPIAVPQVQKEQSQNLKTTISSYLSTLDSLHEGLKRELNNVTTPAAVRTLLENHARIQKEASHKLVAELEGQQKAAAQAAGAPY